MSNKDKHIILMVNKCMVSMRWFIPSKPFRLWFVAEKLSGHIVHKILRLWNQIWIFIRSETPLFKSSIGKEKNGWIGHACLNNMYDFSVEKGGSAKVTWGNNEIMGEIKKNIGVLWSFSSIIEISICRTTAWISGSCWCRCQVFDFFSIFQNYRVKIIYWCF